MAIYKNKNLTYKYWPIQIHILHKISNTQEDQSIKAIRTATEVNSKLKYAREGVGYSMNILCFPFIVYMDF